MGALNLSTTATLGTMLSSQAQPGAASVVSAAGGGVGGFFGDVFGALGSIASGGAKMAQQVAGPAAEIYSAVQSYRLKEKELDLANKLASLNTGLVAPTAQETPVVVSGGGAAPAAQTSQAGFGSSGLLIVGVVAVVLLMRRK